MSVGFRIFLLMLFGFGAVWVYRLRVPEVAQWLRLEAACDVEPVPDPLVSPVESVIGTEMDLGWIRLRGQSRTPLAGTSAGAALDAEGDLPGDPYADPYAGGPGGLSHDQELLAADLPVEDDAQPWNRLGERVPGAEAPQEGEPGQEGTPGEQRGALQGEGGGGANGADKPPAKPGSSALPGEDGRSGSQARPSENFVIHKLAEGESLWSLAEKYLGGGKHVQEILALNKDVLKGRDPGRLPIGTELKIPRRRSRESLKKPPTQVDTSVEAGSGRSTPDATFTLHTVRHNENLRRIAQQYYPGDSNGWEKIFDANRQTVASADLVVEGQVLKIPVSRR